MDFWKGFSRALAGSLIFAFPLLMTLEMWWLGMYVDRYRLMLLALVFLPFLTVLSRYSGFRRTSKWYEDAIDALVALVAGTFIAVAFLAVFGAFTSDMRLDEIIGKVVILAIPASMGAVIASKELGSGEQDQERTDHPSWGGELFIMAAGALFLAFNVAPTDEVVVLAYKMNSVMTILLVLISLVIMHAFVYSLEFKGHHQTGEIPFWVLVLNFTVVGYALSLLISAYVLWTFGRFDGLGLAEGVGMTAVLGFPGALGASTARLVI